MTFTVVLPVVMLTSSMGPGPKPCDVYVAPSGGGDQPAAGALQPPLASLADAARRVAELAPTATNLTVCLLPGKHTTAGAPLTLNASHNLASGGRVTWRATTPGASVITGALSLAKWYRCMDRIHCNYPDYNDVWVHMVADIVPKPPPGSAPFRQLWVGGRRASRVVVDADAVGGKWTVSSTGFITSAAVPGAEAWASSQVEFRWPRQIKNWIEPRCAVTGVSPTAAGGSNISVAPACWSLLQKRAGRLPPQPVLIENMPVVPEPGTFQADPLYVFWRPPADDPYATPTRASVPVPEPVLDSVGLSRHSLIGISFRHGTWRQPSTPEGYVPSQSAVGGWGEPTGLVRFNAASSLVIDQCVFENIGAAYALEVGGGSADVAVTRTNFSTLAGGAVKLGNVNDTRAVSRASAQFDTNFLLEGCVMENIALEFRGASAVFAGYVANTNISHNTIVDTGYTAISLGWGWGTHVFGNQTFAADNHITGNRLSGIMSALNDGGCTYTLGPQPRSTVSGNYCEADDAPVVGCFYHDNGSRYFNDSFNVCRNSPANCVYLQGCCNSPAYDIHVREQWCQNTAPVNNECAKQDCTIDEKTLYMVPTGAPWPPAAQKIVDAAGAQSYEPLESLPF